MLYIYYIFFSYTNINNALPLDPPDPPTDVLVSYKIHATDGQKIYILKPIYIKVVIKVQSTY